MSWNIKEFESAVPAIGCPYLFPVEIYILGLDLFWELLCCDCFVSGRSVVKNYTSRSRTQRGVINYLMVINHLVVY